VDGSPTGEVIAAGAAAVYGERSIEAIITIGLDFAKSVFQVHGADATGNVVVRRQLKRRNGLAFFEKMRSCLVGIEAAADQLQR
jgi:transposase